MTGVDLAGSKARLSELVEQAEAGEVIQIMRCGKPVVRLTAMLKKRAPVDLEMLRKVRASLPFDDEPAGEFGRRMRDEDRY
jgi:antitoxin (DNA-binding transcriptional repressor) of toxin-antitoxin stability system